jgi:hypothetical protein
MVDIKSLTNTEKLEIRKLALVELAKKDLKTFVFEFCKTRYRKRIVKESSRGKSPETLNDSDFIYINAIEPIPKYPYIERMLECFERYNKVAIPKSRQLLVTWVSLAYCLWYALVNQGANIYIQKEKESESGFGDPIDSLGSRLEFMYERLPNEFKDPNFQKKLSPPTLLFGSNYSAIMGVAAGPNQARGKSGSIFLIDEAAFQRFLRDTLTTLVPISESGAQIILVSTANGKESFYDTVSDGGIRC